ncbi:hypothetical protein FQN57_003431 [Myotisia sp. PD_48]|nr:hypothetical protein FQN57_003431 [Myotisia sp. PD_48]
MKLDLSLYLVTDSTPSILGNKDLCEVVEKAIKGGVTIVQYRDKHSDTNVLVSTASKLHEITQKYNVPLIINDRIDVALAVGAEGVHIGQDDMRIEEARKFLRYGTIIGVTVSSTEEAIAAVKGGASYLGIGTVYATPTKTNTKSIIGPAGVRKILASISQLEPKVGTVAIGGINLENVQRILYQSRSANKSLDGVAVVSAIISAPEPQDAASSFSTAISRDPPFALNPPPQRKNAPRVSEVSDLLDDVDAIVRDVAISSPLCHNMINFVVANFAANVALAIGASPIMSGNGAEAADLAKNNGALFVNMGTLNNDSIPNYLKAMRAYNARGNPVVFDPVGAGATQVRRDAVKQLMAGGYFDLIKGNESELQQVYGRAASHQVGVDSGPSTLDANEKATMVRNLALEERTVVLLTGPVDYLSDGWRTIAIENGHPLLGRVTGTGCIIGTITAAFLAVHKKDKLLAALSGLLMFEVAAERAAAHDSVRGPGSFVPALIDELALLSTEAAEWTESKTIQEAARIKFIQLP